MLKAWDGVGACVETGVCIVIGVWNNDVVCVGSVAKDVTKTELILGAWDSTEVSEAFATSVREETITEDDDDVDTIIDSDIFDSWLEKETSFDIKDRVEVEIDDNVDEGIRYCDDIVIGEGVAIDRTKEEGDWVILWDMDCDLEDIIVKEESEIVDVVCPRE